MLLSRWIASKDLTLREAATLLGLKLGTLYDIKRGIYVPPGETIAQIQAATSGRVKAQDHQDAWEASHRDKVEKFRAKGRVAAKAKRIATKERKSAWRKN